MSLTSHGFHEEEEEEEEEEELRITAGRRGPQSWSARQQR
jgi:hypothetical protein